jgi:hypothetical protein
MFNLVPSLILKDPTKLNIKKCLLPINLKTHLVTHSLDWLHWLVITTFPRPMPQKPTAEKLYKIDSFLNYSTECNKMGIYSRKQKNVMACINAI